MDMDHYWNAYVKNIEIYEKLLMYVKMVISILREKRWLEDTAPKFSYTSL